MALADPTTYGAATSFKRIADGKYLEASSTIDEPLWLEVQNTPNPSGVSSYLVKFSQHKNVPGTPNYGDKPAPDDVSSVHIVVRWSHRAHTQTQIKALIDLLVGMIGTSGYQDQILRFER